MRNELFAAPHLPATRSCRRDALASKVRSIELGTTAYFAHGRAHTYATFLTNEIPLDVIIGAEEPSLLDSTLILTEENPLKDEWQFPLSFAVWRAMQKSELSSDCSSKLTRSLNATTVAHVLSAYFSLHDTLHVIQQVSQTQS